MLTNEHHQNTCHRTILVTECAQHVLKFLFFKSPELKLMIFINFYVFALPGYRYKNKNQPWCEKC